MKEPDFIVHDEKDNVGVIVVETVQAGKSLNGWVMANDESLTLVSGNDIPIGHKIALKDLSEGDTAVKYGEDIGRITAAVAVGGHVHTQNLKTKRW
jgi:(2R)-sulfolactate sulfo-lyase subunit alpha